MSERLTLLAVHPHPDDESISCGGTLARYAAEGIRTVVVTCTGGEEGENQAGIDLAGVAMADHRRREMAAAAEALGLHGHHWLGYRDSGMAGTAANDHPESFHAAGLDEAAEALAALIRRERPQVVISDDANGTYGHPDHIKAHHVTVRAVEVAADPGAPVDGAPWRVAKRYVFALGRAGLADLHARLIERGLASPFGDRPLHLDDLPFGVPDEELTSLIDVTEWLGHKRDAMAAHRTQIGPDSFFLNVPDDLAGGAFGIESYVLEDGELGAEVGPETDLFAGLRTDREDGERGTLVDETTADDLEPT